MSAYDVVSSKLQAGDALRTPDKSMGKPFTIDAVDPESVTVRTARGGRVKLSLFTFDSAVKYLEDGRYVGDHWLPVKDEMFQAVLNMDNDRVRAASYIVAVLGHVGLIDVDGGRPNRVRLAAPAGAR